MEETKTNYDEFITIYNEIDDYMRNELDVDQGVPHTDLIKRISEKNKVFARYSNDLLSFARLRNAIVHNPYKRHADPIADPHNNVVKKYQHILSKVLNPAKAIDTIAVRSENIFTADLDDRALKVMAAMNENTYTHVPVIENGRLIGVFSENTVFSYIVKTKDVILEKEVKLREFSEFIPISKHESESFAFVSREALVADVEQMFADQLQQGKRLAVVFITHNGAPGEKLLGMITAWDIAGYQEE